MSEVIKRNREREGEREKDNARLAPVAAASSLLSLPTNNALLLLLLLLLLLSHSLRLHSILPSTAHT